jgi:TldD protein
MVLDALPSRGLQYADVRVTEQVSENLAVKNGNVAAVTRNSDSGFGLRVIVDGAWGFASSSRLDEKEIKKVVRDALEIAKASSLTRVEPVVLSPLKPQKGSYKTDVKKDPFKVPLEQKIELLLAADVIARRNQAVKVSKVSMWSLKTKKVFASTQGSLVSEDRTECGAELSALAIEGSEVQQRTYPALSGDTRQAGYEFIEELDLKGNAERNSGEAALLLTAPPCPAGLSTVILAGSQMVLQLHESVGHPIELDRVNGTEASYAGTSFLTTDKLNKLRYGSDLINVTADATVPGGLGTFGWDDEGVPAQSVPVIRQGLFVGYLSSRETAPRLGLASGGAMRADGWSRIPIIRMTNINLEPGRTGYQDLIAGAGDAVLFDTTKTWSIDDKRLNFQFTTEIAWEIKNGKLTGRVFKNPTYTGITPEFWNSCDAVGDRNSWRMWGVPNCGKGQPGQSAHVGHGVPPARFRKVRIGISS